MLPRSPKSPLPPDVNQDTDCLPPGSQSAIPAMLPSDPAWRPARLSGLRWLERLALAVERPVNRLVGATTLNPLYHTGTLAVFFWLVVAGTGLFLTFFYQFGYDAAYHAVTKIESSLLARVIRAVHRYASALALLVTLLHAYRLLFMDRFRGPRWLAWVTGVVMVGLLWLDGVTGYWLVWDQRAQAISEAFVGWVDRLTPWGDGLAAALLSAERTDRSWIVLFLVLAVHILLFLVLAGLYWLHVVRLSRARFLPPRVWLAVGGGVVVVLSALAPLGMLPKADFRQLPGLIPLDLFYLFYLPADLNGWGVWLWGSLLLVGVLALVLPWLPRRPAAPNASPITIDKGLCTGCTECARDCPYQAITMAPRRDGKPHKYVAIEDPSRCVACGVCVGSCDLLAVSLAVLDPHAVWNAARTRLDRARRRHPDAPITVVYTCERHALHGARPYLEDDGLVNDDGVVEVIPLPCVASAQPNLVSATLDLGAAEVRVVGCPPDDCSRREGNAWMEARLTRQRVPRLKRAYATAPIGTFWLAPDAFGEALAAPLVSVGAADAPATQPGRWSIPLTWRNFAPALALLAAVFAVVMALTAVPVSLFGADARLQLVVADPARLVVSPPLVTPPEAAGWPTRLVLEVDGATGLAQPLDPTALAQGRVPSIATTWSLPPGEHTVRLWLDGGAPGSPVLLLVDETMTLTPRQNLLLDETVRYRGSSP